MAFTSTEDALAALGLGFLRTEALSYVPEPRNQRQRPFAAVDFKLCVVGFAVDTNNPHATIETVTPTFHKIG